MRRRWDRFFGQCRKDLKLWLFCVALLAAYRLVFIFIFRNRIDPATPPREIFWFVVYGIGFDAPAVTIWAALPFLFSVGSFFADKTSVVERFRLAWAELFCALYAGACVITWNYFKEYNNQLNHFVVNFFYDDKKAIFQTIWSEYHLPEIFLLIAGLTAITVLSVRTILASKCVFENFFEHPGMSRWIQVPLSFFAALSIAIVSSNMDRTEKKLWQLHRDVFLSQAVTNPFVAFYRTVKTYVIDAHSIKGLDTFLPDHDIRHAAQTVFRTHDSFPDLDRYFLRLAPGAASPPRHVFLIVMESYDTWPLMDKYSPLHLADNLKQLGRDGIFVQNFLPSGDSTIQTLSALFTGLPYTWADMTTSVKTFPTALAVQFKRLGYKTNLFYGGDAKYYNLSAFAPKQGFDNVYGCDRMADKSLRNIWGVPDEYLFNFILNTLDDAVPTFNMVMTTSYHPPYDVDVYGKGFQLRTIPQNLVPSTERNADLNLKTLGHLWYSDQCLGSFVRKAEKRFPAALFAITGDHRSRKYVSVRPTLYERSAVPFVMYGRAVLNSVKLPPDLAGSQLDIGPTLIELAAPKDFTYYAIGTSLLHAGKDHVGIGWYRVIGSDFLLAFEGPAQFQPLSDGLLRDTQPLINEMEARLKYTYAIGWWRLVRGSRID